MDTIALDANWNPYVDANGNIAMLAGDEAIAQDVASAQKTFKGEVWYDTTLGIPYLQQVLGFYPPASFIKARLNAAALTVPGTIKAVSYLSYSSAARQVVGQTQTTTINDTVVVTSTGV